MRPIRRHDTRINRDRPHGSCHRRRPGTVMTTSAANARIRSFIALGQRLRHQHSNGLDDERIPDDPDGDVVVMR